MSDYKRLRLGYACINQTLRNEDPEIFTSRGVTLARFKREGVDYVKELINKNIDDLLTIVKWNETNNIRFFRVSSTMFPHYGNWDRGAPIYDINFAKKKLQEVGEFANSHDHRLTFHAQPYVTLSSPDKYIYERALFDLRMHFKCFDWMKCGSESVVILHGGGIHDSKRDSLKRWGDRFEKLQSDERRRICLENDEFIYGVLDILPFCERYKIPMCLDFFHNSVSQDKIELTPEIMSRIVSTWKDHGIPKFHMSDQAIGERIGTHADYVESLPEEAIELVKHINIDIMIEAKQKELAVLKLMKKYKRLF